jgi:hypothetical protein
MTTQTDAHAENLGTRRIPALRMANFPNADEIVRQGLMATPRSGEAVDILLVNPPSPDGGIWIRTQHRVGWRRCCTRPTRSRSWTRLPSA